MKNEHDIFNEIQKNLIAIKTHGWYIDQYDERLFELFIEAYHNDSASSLTADWIIARLHENEEYTSKTISYDLDNIFREKWQRWTEAFQKGLSGGHITLNN